MIVIRYISLAKIYQKCFCGRSSAPDPTGKLIAVQDFLDGLGATSRQRLEGRIRRGMEERKSEVNGRGRRGNGTGSAPDMRLSPGIVGGFVPGFRAPIFKLSEKNMTTSTFNVAVK